MFFIETKTRNYNSVDSAEQFKVIRKNWGDHTSVIGAFEWDGEWTRIDSAPFKIDETITTTSKHYFLPAQNLLVSEWDIGYLKEEEKRLDFLKAEYRIRRGEKVILQEKTGTLHKRPSRFMTKQLDGSWDFYGWYELDSDPATYKIISDWKWAGRKWREQ